MKNLTFLVLFLVTVTFVNAQQDAKSKQILDEVSIKTQSFKTISADFIFTLTNDELEDFNEKSKGSIKLKGNKYVVSLPDIGMKVFSNGKTVWNYMEEGNQVTISNAEDNQNELMNPSTVFTLYEKGFESKYLGEVKEGNNAYHQIALFPDIDQNDVSKIILLIDKSKMMIHSASLFGTDGNLYGIEISEINATQEIPDSTFEFNPNEYNDVVIIDFRDF